MQNEIVFPDHAETIAADVARFRALPPEEQAREWRSMLGLHRFLAGVGDRAAEVRRLADEDKERELAAIREFVARHEHRHG